MTDNAVTITAPEGLPFVDIQREFEAPVEAVYTAHADPDLVARWLGPDGLEMDIEEWDLRSGGRYRYVHRDASAAYGFTGMFHVARPGEIIIQTFEFDGWPDVVSIETLRFERLDGDRTRLSIHAVYPSLEARDGMVASGQAVGVTEGYARLDGVLAGD